jgi:hypothetical protein
VPYAHWGCSICGMQCPTELRAHGAFTERMRWLRRHRKLHHPYDFIASTRKGVKTRKGSRRENG